MIDDDLVLSCRAGISCRLNPGVGPRDDRPRVRMGGRFACEITGVELLESGVDVVGVEVTIAAMRSSVSISTMLSDSKSNALLVVANRHADTKEREAFSAGRNDVRRGVREPRDRRLPACCRSRPADHVGSRRSPPVDDRHWICRRPYLGNGVPVMGRECLEAFGYSGRCVFQPRRRPTELFESGERGVEVRLVE